MLKFKHGMMALNLQPLSVGLNRVALVMWALATHNNKLGKGVHATKGGCEGERGNTLWLWWQPT